MKCKYKELFEKDGECGLTYPECMKFVLCAYEDKYHERLQDAMDIERELAEERSEDNE